MRIIGAWLLLSITLFHWIGGLLCFEMIYHIEMRHNMNALEQTIADAVQACIDAETTVKVLDAGTVLPKGYVYGNYFAFSEEVEGQTVFYTLLEQTDAITYEKVSVPPSASLTDREQALLIKSLLYEFVVADLWCSDAALQLSHTDCFLPINTLPLMERPIPTPPPDSFA
ncbi:MAG TPA: hypothetical protein PKD70_05790 [Saprospiraceae bacterium]|nr:hypothetical protein [Saprospiraceae bacterium]HMP13371.1 hypothetical protein [Saprospiraceae bacterium]